MINWKVRLKNPHVWVQVALSVAAPVFAYYGITGQDLTTWKAVGDVVRDALSNPFVLTMSALSVYNVLIDPTTKGVGDSSRALNYNHLGGK